MKYKLVPVAIAAEVHQEMLCGYLKYTQATKPVTEKLRSLADEPAAQTTDKSAGEKNANVSQNDKPTLILVEREELIDTKVNQKKPENPSPAPKAFSQKIENNPKKPSNSQSAQALPALRVQATHPSSPVEVLRTLSPKKLLQELLGRVLTQGIGRLYFEQKSPQRGRIVCSQNGSFQCVLSDISMPVFQALIDELKILTNLPLVPVKEAQQVEVERFYQQERLLLRLQVMPGTHGEQATLQVLRGEALKFYQQQQVAHLSRDALAIATALQQKLKQLQQRANLNPNLPHDQSESLLALNQLLESVEQQLEKLKNSPS
jgi:type II secretory ATPase GspE/PulE/Tfp pilus assembly ATPase PilB-like protein